MGTEDNTSTARTVPVPTESAEVSEPTRRVGLYADPSKAVDAVNSSFNTWTRQLTERSFELSMAVVAANWATFTAINPLLGNVWAKASVGTVVVGLAVTIVSTWYLSEQMRKQVNHAESDWASWAKEYDLYKNKIHPWPYTKRITDGAAALRVWKTLIPLLAGVFYVVALFSP